MKLLMGLRRLFRAVFPSALRKRENYRSNCCHDVPVEATADGFLVDQRRAACYRYGAFCCDYNGCGWIAIYNMLLMLGERERPADLIRYLEEQGVFRGAILGGCMGTYPWSVVGYFRRRGRRVRWGLRKSTIARLAETAKAGALFYQRPNGTAHYVAFSTTGRKPVEEKPAYRFLNYCDCGGGNLHEMTLDEFWRRTKRLWQIGILVE